MLLLMLKDLSIVVCCLRVCVCVCVCVCRYFTILFSSQVLWTAMLYFLQSATGGAVLIVSLAVIDVFFVNALK